MAESAEELGDILDFNLSSEVVRQKMQFAVRTGGSEHVCAQFHLVFVDEVAYMYLRKVQH